MAVNVDIPNGQDLTNVRMVKPTLGSALPHFLPLGIFPLIILSLLYGGWWILAAFVFFMLAGPLDIAFGDDERSMDPVKTPRRLLFWHDLPVWIWAVLWPPTLVFGIWQILAADLFPVWECVLLAIVLTCEAQAVFIVGHELIHRRTNWERRIGEFLLSSVSYPQYATEHVYIHHALVGTPYDAGSAPKGQSFWQYFPREVVHNLTGSWRIVRERLARRRLPVWHHSNPFWRYVIETAFWYALVVWLGGPWAVPVYVFLSLGVVFSMKVANYMQHYGLRRVRLPNGRFETIRPRHSWNANYKFSNWMFYNMQRHPDHHAVASRPYPLLQNHGADESPQLPGSYGQMFALVVRPKRWFETMDPLVDQWRAHFYPEIDDWSAYDSQVSAARPEAFDAIVEIFGVAPYLAQWIERHPELLESLQDKEFTDLDLPTGFGPDRESEAIARQGLARLYWMHEFGVPEMKERIAEIPVRDVSDTVDSMQSWSNEKAFQVGMHVLRGNLTPIEAEPALSNLAESSISAVLSAVAEEFEDRHGTQDHGGVAAIVLGDLASREASLRTTLDVLFVHEGDSPGLFDGFCQRSFAALGDLTRDSLLFAPTRPNTDGRAVRALADFGEATLSLASARELQDLPRARCIFEFGSGGIAQRFEDARREALSSAVVRDTVIAGSRQTGDGAIGTAVFSPETMRGGIQDIDRLARRFQLLIGANAPIGSAPSSASVFLAAASQAQLSEDVANKLAEAVTLWRNFRGARRLVAGDDVPVDSLGSRVKAVLARACGQDDFDSLTAAIEDMAVLTAAEIDTLDGMMNRGTAEEEGSPVSAITV